MPITVKHSKTSTIPDAGDTNLVQPSDWNADHSLAGLGTMAEQNANAVAITGGTITGVSGLGTVTSVAATAGTGISVTGSPITTSGTLNIINTAPDQTVAIANGTGISVTGTYPNFTITNTSPSSGGTVTSVTGTSPVVSSGGNTPAISMPAATTSVNGYLTSTDWTTFNNKSNTNGTVTSVAALTLGTTGTDLSSTVANGTTTPVITLQVPTASASNRGALSAADWTTFNNKAQTGASNTFTGAQIGNITTLTDGATITPNFALNNSFTVTLGGNRTLANPTNLVAGQSGVIIINQDGTGGRTLAYGSNYDFAGATAPTLTTTASAQDMIAYFVVTTSRINCVFTGNLA